MSYQGTKINPKKYDRSQIKFLLVLIPLAVFMVLPIIYIFVTAFKPLNELNAYPPRFTVHRPTMDNFEAIGYVMSESGIPLSRFLLNSIVTSLLVVVLTVIIAVSAGYVLSKKQFGAKKMMLALNTAALMFVPIAVRIPRYLVMEKLNLLDNFFSNILPLLAMPVGLFLIKQFIDLIPDALIEAAKIDGANDYYILWKIVIPIILPAIVTVAILAFQLSWNSSDESTLYVNRDEIKTFAFFLSTFAVGSANTVAGQGMSAAAALIMFVPNLIIFILMQNKVLNTMAHSGIK